MFGGVSIELTNHMTENVVIGTPLMFTTKDRQHRANFSVS